jgi:putative PIN family toxin of toxin-antitoxin system
VIRRVVLDTNVIASGLGWPGPSAEVLDAALCGRLVLVTSPPLLAELRRVLTYPKLADFVHEPELVADLIEASSVVVAPSRTIAAVRDEPDNRVLEAALEAAADFIVTGDKELLALGAFEGIPVLRPARLIADVLRIEAD